MVRAIRALDSAGPEAISLAVSARYAEELRDCRAGAVLVPDELADAPAGPRTRIVVPDPYAALVRVIGHSVPARRRAAGRGPDGALRPRVVLGRDVSDRTLCGPGRGSGWATAAAGRGRVTGDDVPWARTP